MPKIEDKNLVTENLGSRTAPKLRMADFPSADEIVQRNLNASARSEGTVDILFVNPPHA